MTSRCALREWAGVTLLDSLRYGSALYAPWRRADAWTRLCNRIERLTENPNGRGLRCEWKWGSDLHAPTVWPSWGRRLLDVALAEWPIRFAGAPVSRSGTTVSFVFAHAGADRFPQLLSTLSSVFAQTDVQVECVVVDQSPEPLEALLPRGVVYHHLDKRHCEPGWHKSWAYNVGARMASGDILVFHDGDICAPERYAAEVVRSIHHDGYQAVSLQRFLYCLDEPSTARLEELDDIPADVKVSRVYQNWKGGTIALEREVFFAVGGFDEGFVDWGGEDDEFYHRCQVIRHCRYGYLPFVHLWHAPQAGRHRLGNANVERILPERLDVPASVRRDELARRDPGQWDQPDPALSYRSRLSRVEGAGVA